MKQLVITLAALLATNSAFSTSIKTNFHNTTESDLAVQAVVATGGLAATTGIIGALEFAPLTQPWHIFTSALTGIGLAATTKLALHPEISQFSDNESTACAVTVGVIASYFYFKYRPDSRARANNTLCTQLAYDHVGLSLFESYGKPLNEIETNMGNIAALSRKEFLLPEAVNQVENYLDKVQSAQKELVRLSHYPSLNYPSLLQQQSFLNEKIGQVAYVLREVKMGNKYINQKMLQKDEERAQRTLEIEQQKANAATLAARAKEKNASAQEKIADTQSSYFWLDLLKWATR